MPWSDPNFQTRAEITQLLNEFQAGYERRDTSRANEFADRLFSQHNILVLGTMPQEVFIGHSEATKVVQTDWESWGDCTFLVDQANISAFGDVAWISTIGYVEFDLSRFLVMPLRLTGVAVKEAGTWKFQQLQYQFDLDLSFLLLLIMVLIVLLSASIAVLLTRIGFALVELRETEKPR